MALTAESASDDPLDAPPPLPPRPATAPDDGCSCGAVNPVDMESAWEQMAALRAKGGGAGSGGSINSSSVRVSPTEILDLRIFCGTWNVAGKQAIGRMGAV